MIHSPVDDALLKAVEDAVREAGRLIQRVRAEGFEVTEKDGDRGPVTRADRAADGHLRTVLPRLHDAAWLSEETKDDGLRLGRDRVWIVDPLDGTKEFVEGVPHYSVSVGLVVDGAPVLGVVHNPSTGEMVSARKGGGCRLDGAPVRVAPGRRLGASRSEMRRGEFAPFEGAWDIEPVGSIAWKLALVACGRLAATVSRGPKHEWDVAGGAALVAEAGGTVADALGVPLPFNQAFPKVRGILAGAPEAYASVLETCRAAGMSDRMKELG